MSDTFCTNQEVTLHRQKRSVRVPRLALQRKSSSPPEVGIPIPWAIRPDYDMVRLVHRRIHHPLCFLYCCSPWCYGSQAKETEILSNLFSSPGHPAHPYLKTDSSCHHQSQRAILSGCLLKEKCKEKYFAQWSWQLAQRSDSKKQKANYGSSFFSLTLFSQSGCADQCKANNHSNFHTKTRRSDGACCSRVFRIPKATCRNWGTTHGGYCRVWSLNSCMLPWGSWRPLSSMHHHYA